MGFKKDFSLCSFQIWIYASGLSGLYAYQYGSQNVALGKTASMKDTHSSGLATAKNGVDGNTNGNFNAGSCIHTATTANAWWKVDLGEVYILTHVKLFNRLDCCSFRLADVQVWISEADYDYSMEGFHSGAIGTSYVFELRPFVHGRWVKIDRKVDIDQLSFCEIEVYGLRGKGKFTLENDKVGSGTLLRTTQAESELGCGVRCTADINCHSFNYNVATDTCDLLTTAATTISSDNDVSYYEIS